MPVRIVSIVVGRMVAGERLWFVMSDVNCRMSLKMVDSSSWTSDGGQNLRLGDWTEELASHGERSDGVISNCGASATMLANRRSRLGFVSSSKD